jgi:hypothetical protein
MIPGIFAISLRGVVQSQDSTKRDKTEQVSTAVGRGRKAL